MRGGPSLKVKGGLVGFRRSLKGKGGLVGFRKTLKVQGRTFSFSKVQEITFTFSKFKKAFFKADLQKNKAYFLIVNKKYQNLIRNPT